MASDQIPTSSRRVAVVTGGNHGIGAATAIAAGGGGRRRPRHVPARRRADATRERPPEYAAAPVAQRADEVLAAIGPLPGRGAAIEADLRDDDVAGADLRRRRARSSGRCRSSSTTPAAGSPTRSLRRRGSGAGSRRSPATIARNLGVDARAGALLIAELARRHVARGAAWGRIVGADVGRPGGFPQEVSYGAAKAALENYIMSAASELATFGITANVVHPPVTDTGWITDDVRAFVASSPDHHHVAAPADVAEVIAWLCSDAARLVIGHARAHAVRAGTPRRGSPPTDSCRASGRRNGPA